MITGPDKPQSGGSLIATASTAGIRSGAGASTNPPTPSFVAGRTHKAWRRCCGEVQLASGAGADGYMSRPPVADERSRTSRTIIETPQRGCCVSRQAARLLPTPPTPPHPLSTHG